MKMAVAKAAKKGCGCGCLGPQKPQAKPKDKKAREKK